MLCYATITGTRRNLDAMRRHGWRLLLTPDAMDRCKLPPGFAYAVDNGAWGCFQRGRPFDAGAFGDLARQYGEKADWIALPDIVAGGLDSLAFSVGWLPRLRGPVLLPVQDGMVPADVRPYIGGRVGLFLGGSTPWKLATMRQWGALAREAGVYYHVARVNTARRIRLCQDAGAHSFDGTSATRFALTTPKLTAAARQLHLFGGLND